MLRNIGNKLQLLHVFTITNVHRMPFDMAVLKAIVSSFKMREDKSMLKGMLHMKALRSLSPSVPLHHEARRECGGNPLYQGKRITVSDEQVPWSYAWPTYNPKEFTAQNVINNSALLLTGHQWADPAELRGPAVKKGFESLLAEVRERTTYIGGEKLAKATSLAKAISFDAAGVPLNPRGRTGLSGRGLLGKWGANHAADPIVTRHLGTQLQMVAIKRKDTGDWAIPGGMLDEGEMVGDTLRREFTEEVGGHMKQTSKARFEELTAELFKKGDLIYCGCE
jgi:ADP-ribose pyrophosphatase